METDLSKYCTAANELAEAQAEWKKLTDSIKAKDRWFSEHPNPVAFLTWATQGKGPLMEKWPTVEQVTIIIENIKNKKDEAEKYYALIPEDNRKMVKKV